jgi:multidrug efflux pump subunit AcrA (membrane-fusion protein)
VEFSVDETDMDKVKVGETATVVFDALPNNTYTGAVTQVDASLSTVSGYQALKGVITLELTTEQSASPFLSGLTGSVEIINGKAENALLVPLEALRDLGDGQYGVMVVQSDSSLKLKVVEVGLMDDTYAEIKSGVSLGDKVSTGLAETK